MSETMRKRGPGFRLVLSSEDLPGQLDTHTRARMWIEQMEALFGSFSGRYSEHHPFNAKLEVLSFGDVNLTRSEGTVTGITRTEQQVADSGTDDFALSVNLGGATTLCNQRGTEMEVTHGGLGLVSNGEPGEVQAKPDGPVWSVGVSRRMLSELFKDPDDAVMQNMDPNTAAAKLLKRYLGLLYEPDGLAADPALTDHVGRTVADLVALTIGAGREAAEVAKFRGGRAARLELILAEIKTGFDDPRFSPHVLGARLGLSPRYIQNLLSETGRSFSERVLELRLQKALTMLSDPRCRVLKVAEIAEAAGFSDIPHFNHNFRRRFGGSPKQFRA